VLLPNGSLSDTPNTPPQALAADVEFLQLLRARTCAVAYDGYGSEAEYSVLPLLLDLSPRLAPPPAGPAPTTASSQAPPAGLTVLTGPAAGSPPGSPPGTTLPHPDTVSSPVPCVHYHLRGGVTVHAPVGTLPGAAGDAASEETIHPGSPHAPAPGQHYQQPSEAMAAAWRRQHSSASRASCPGTPLAGWGGTGGTSATAGQYSRPAVSLGASPRSSSAAAAAAAGGLHDPGLGTSGGFAALQVGGGPSQVAGPEFESSLEAALRLPALADEHLDEVPGTGQADAAAAGGVEGRAGGVAAAAAGPAEGFSAEVAMRALGIPAALRAHCCATAFHDSELFLRWGVGGGVGVGGATQWLCLTAARLLSMPYSLSGYSLVAPEAIRDTST
jgi:hypothetical protein